MAKEQRTASQQISAPLVDRIVHQEHHLGECHIIQRHTKVRIRYCKRMQQNVEAKNLQIQLPSTLQRSMELSQEKGASTWLSSLPIDDHGFALHKSAFRAPVWLVATESTFSLHLWSSFQYIDHALTCKTGGFPAIRHNEVRHITASLLSEVCHRVTIEPHLQPLTGEVMSHNTAATEDGVRLDVAMYGFWGGRFEKAFVDIRVFNPCAQSNCRSPLLHPCTGDMSKKRSDSMRRGYGKWNVLLSLHLLCQQLEVWAELQPHSTRGWLP